MKSADRFSRLKEAIRRLPDFAYLAEETVYKVSGNWYELTYVPCLMNNLPEGIEYVAYLPHPNNKTLLEDGPQCIAKFKSDKPLPKKMEISYWTISADKEYLRKIREEDSLESFNFLKQSHILKCFLNNDSEQFLSWSEICHHCFNR